jgi:hypothetical protein
VESDHEDSIAHLMRECAVSFQDAPVVRQHADGSWSAQYPGAKWFVAADNPYDASQLLFTIGPDRMSASQDADL